MTEQTDRNRAIVTQRGLGRSFSSIAEEHGMSPSGVSLVYQMAHRRPRIPGLSTRAGNIVFLAGNDLTPREVWERGPQAFLDEPNAGRVSIIEIAEWLRSHGHVWDLTDFAFKKQQRY